MTRKVNYQEVKVVFEEVNAVLIGKPLPVAYAALTDLMTAAICYGCKDLPRAKKLAGRMSADIQKSIEKNFDHYHNTSEPVHHIGGNA